MSSLRDELAGGDRRSIGKSNSVVRAVLHDPARFAEIMEGLSDQNPLVRMRCADVAEKVSRAGSDCLQPYQRKLLDLAGGSNEQEMRWHLAQMLPRLDLNPEERCRAEAIMLEYLNDKSRIVKTFAMQALAELAIGDLSLRRRLMPLLGNLARTGSPAMRARARKLIRHLKDS